MNLYSFERLNFEEHIWKKIYIYMFTVKQIIIHDFAQTCAIDKYKISKLHKKREIYMTSHFSV